MKPEDQPYMGTAEVAEYLGISKQLVVNWTKRYKLPQTVANLAMGKIWKTTDIVEFGNPRVVAKLRDK